MEHAQAESRESMAAYGRLYPAFGFLNCLDPLTVRMLRGPEFGHPLHEWMTHGEKERVPQIFSDGLALTISRFIDGDEANRAKLKFLHDAAREKCLLLDYSPFTGLAITKQKPSIGTISVNIEGEHCSCMTGRNPDSTYALPTPSHVADIADWFDLEMDQAEELCIEIHAHRVLGNHIFITTNKRLLADRYRHGFIKDVGIHSLDEACEKAGVILRRSGTYPLERIGPFNRTMSGWIVYHELSQLMLSNVLTALRSAVNPNAKANVKNTFESINAMMIALTQLLIAVDELAVLNWEDQYVGGNNNIIERQMYHFQFGLILVSSILDLLAVVIAKYDGAKIDHVTDLSYRKLIEAKIRWVREITDARPLAEYAKEESVSELLLACNELRNIVAHRGGLQFGVGFITKILDPTRLITSEELRFGTILVKKDEVDMGKHDRMAGALYGEDESYILPFPFMKTVAVLLAEYVNGIFGFGDWPDSDWFRLAENKIEPPVRTDNDNFNMLLFFDKRCASHASEPKE